jgi:hypothetical protein
VSIQESRLGEIEGSGVWLAASQITQRPPAEVFPFVATDHFQNHPTWEPAVTAITQTSPGPMSVGATAWLARTDRRRQVHGSMEVEVTGYQPASSSTVVSRFGPFTLPAQTTFAPVAPAGTRLQLVIDTHARPWGHGLLLPLLRGRFRKTMLRSLRVLKEQVEETASPTT